MNNEHLKITDLFKKGVDKMKNNKKSRCFFAIIVALAIVLFFCSFEFSSTKNTQTADVVSEYATELENKLSKVLSEVDGAGKVSVAITVESGMETVIAMKTTQTTTENGTEIVETPILVNGKTVVLKENYPKVVGVVIVCEGAKNISVLNKIQQATVSLLNVKSEKIEILTMK